MQISALLTLVKQKQREIADSMASGHCASFERYQYLSGMHAGLQETLSLINNLLEEEKRDDV